jgi:formate-dependent nitrite reductase membrane component NrfD
MNPYVGDPHWGWYIVWYFFLGGIAAGAYVMATLVDLVGTAEDRRTVRYGYYLAFPLLNVCGLLLVVDLGRPERFWHMMIENQTLRPMFKWWSPMSIGAWALLLFTAVAGASFVGVLCEDRVIRNDRLSRLAARLRTGWIGRLFHAVGAINAFFVASYTGVLLTATNQPVWADTTWLGALFLASATTSGLAAIGLCNALFGPALQGPLARLEGLDRWAMTAELGLLAALALALGRWAPAVLTRWPGVLIPAAVIPLGILLPALLQARAHGRGRGLPELLVLGSAFLLRYAIVMSPLTFLD